MSTLTRRNRNPLTGVGLGAVVTPMLDMTFQLLFFFILNFKPLSTEGQVDLALLAADGKPEPVLIDRERVEYVIYVNSIAAKDGGKPKVVDVEGIERIRFTSKLESIELDEKNLLKALEAKLRTIPKFEDRPDEKRYPAIVICCNGKLKYEHVITLLDLCRKVGKERGINDIGLRGYPK